jgi:hypothetical protein
LNIGFNIGNNLINKTVDNPKGYFERWDVIMMNDEFLGYQNASYHTGVSNFSNMEALKMVKANTCKN